MDKNFTIQLLRWIARGFFVLAVLALGTTLLRSRADTDAEKPQHPIVTLEERQPVDIDWATQRFFTWGSDELGIRLECPVGWSPSQVFDRFTKRRVADLTAYDVVAFRSGEPRSVIAIIRYVADAPLTWDEWLARAQAPVRPITERGGDEKLNPPPLSEEFGARDYAPRLGTLGDRPALWVDATAGVRFPVRSNFYVEQWAHRSVFVAAGRQALRMTYGGDSRQIGELQPGFQRCLESLRWSPPAEPPVLDPGA